MLICEYVCLRYRWKPDDYVHPLLFTALVRNPTLKELKISHPVIPPYHPSTNGKTGAGKSLAHKGFSNNPSIHRPPLTSVPPFRTLRRLCLTNLPSVSAFIDDYSPAIFFSPTLESISLSWRDPTPLGRMLFLQRILQQKKPPTARGVGIGVGTGRPGDPQTAGKLRLKELELRNVVFDFPMVGDIKEWLDMAQLEKLSLLDCEVIDVASWLELIGAGSHGAIIESEQPTGFLSGGGGFTVNAESPGAASPVVSTPGTTPGSTASVIRVVQLKLKSLRINSCAAHWALLLSSFDGLEELYILDPPVVAHDEAENATRFLEAIERHHGATLKRLRLCSRWSYERLDVSRLFRSCAGLEELAISMLHSQWVTPPPFFFFSSPLPLSLPLRGGLANTANDTENTGHPHRLPHAPALHPHPRGGAAHARRRDGGDAPEHAHDGDSPGADGPAQSGGVCVS